MYSYQITDGKRTGEITTKHGMIHLPTFMPVTTFGDKYPLDKMVQPYLKRMSDCLMVSHFYAQQMKKRPEMPIFIDSGGFASLFEGSEIVEHEEYACIKTKEGDEINPVDVLQFQMKHADLGATLDFIIPPGTEESEALSRQKLTIQNALFVKKQAQKDEFMLYASLQCWDEQSARHWPREYMQKQVLKELLSAGWFLMPRTRNILKAQCVLSARKRHTVQFMYLVVVILNSSQV